MRTYVSSIESAAQGTYPRTGAGDQATLGPPVPCSLGDGQTMGDAPATGETPSTPGRSSSGSLGVRPGRFGDHGDRSMCLVRRPPRPRPGDTRDGTIEGHRLIGPSGCGKSTFMRILNRMHEVVPGAQLAGKVDLDGEDIYGPTQHATEVRRHIGMVFQKPNPFPAMSIYDNVLRDLRFRARRSSDRDALVEEIAPEGRSVERGAQPPRELGGELSGGQQQRLCIARALAVRPVGPLDGRAVFGPRPHVDPANRGDDPRDRGRTSPSSSSPTTCSRPSVCPTTVPFFLAAENEPGRIVESGSTEQMFQTPRTNGRRTMCTVASADAPGRSARPRPSGSRLSAATRRMAAARSLRRAAPARRAATLGGAAGRQRAHVHRLGLELRGRRPRPVGGQDRANDGDNINYQTSSSVIGLNEFAQQQVDFGASEIGYSTNQANYTPPGGYAYQYLPDVAGATCLMYNLSGAGGPISNLQLDPSDARESSPAPSPSGTPRSSLALNPGVALPNAPILVVYRTDASGENYIFSDYLRHPRPAWPGTPSPRAGCPGGPQGPLAVPAEGGSTTASTTSRTGSARAAPTVRRTTSLPRPAPSPTSRPGTPRSTTCPAHRWRTPVAIVCSPSYNDAVALEADQLHRTSSRNSTGVFSSTQPSAYPISAYSYLITPEGEKTADKGAVARPVHQVLRLPGSAGGRPARLLALAAQSRPGRFRGHCPHRRRRPPPSAPTA